MIFGRLYVLGLTVLVVIAALLFHLNPDNFLADDAYFYPQIADQIVQGHGSTFHQYSFTNGYQPLWMVFSIIAAGIAQGDKILLLHILGAFQAAFLLMTLYYLFNLTLVARLRFFSAGLAFLTIIMLTVGGLRLFEAHLAIALQMAAFYLFIRLWQCEPTLNDLAACSMLLGMIFLARTDAFFLSASYGIVLGLKICKEQKPLLQKVLRIGFLAVPAILIAVLYMSFNRLAFGHPVPISGVIKSSYPHISWDWGALGMQGKYIVASTLTLLAASLYCAQRQKDMQALFTVAFLAVALHAAYIMCFSWGSQWHYTTAFAIFPVCLQFLLTRLWQKTRHSKVFKAGVCSATFVVLGLMVVVGYLKSYYYFSVSLLAAGKEALVLPVGKSPRLQLVDEVNRNIPPGEGLAVFDSPGVLAYFTHVRVLPIDGLVNDREYDSSLLEDGFVDYLNKHNIHYFMAANLAPGQEYHSATLRVLRKGDKQVNTVYAPIQKKSAGTFSLSDSQIVFDGPNPIPGSSAFTKVSVWRLGL